MVAGVKHRMQDLGHCRRAYDELELESSGEYSFHPIRRTLGACGVGNGRTIAIKKAAKSVSDTIQAGVIPA